MYRLFSYVINFIPNIFDAIHTGKEEWPPIPKTTLGLNFRIIIIELKNAKIILDAPIKIFKKKIKN